MKKIAFISDNLEFDEPISRILREFNSKLNIEIEVLDRLSPKPSIIDKLTSLLNEIELVIFYISKGSPNIYYEIGMAHALGKEVVLITRASNLIPLDLNHHKIILAEDTSFEKSGFEVFKSIENALNKNKSSYPSLKKVYSKSRPDFLETSDIKFDDLYNYSGFKRHEKFESWFFELLRNVDQWEMLRNEGIKPEAFYDFLIWNNSGDPDWKVLGNPVPIELKALNSMSNDFVFKLAENLKKQGLKSLILATTATNKNNYIKLAQNILDKLDFMVVALDKDDLRKIQTSEELYYAIKKKLLRIGYME